MPADERDCCTFTETGLEPGRQYTYYASSVRPDGVETPLYWAATAPAGEVSRQVAPEYSAAGQPQGLGLRIVAGEVRLLWQADAKSVTRDFVIRRREASETEWVILAIRRLHPTETSYEFRDITAVRGQTYIYGVASRDQLLIESAIVETAPIAAPTPTGTP
jgi:hypothetical protein